MKKHLMPLLLAVCLLLAGCGASAPEPSPSPSAEPTAEPTPTEEPAAPTPSPTAEPTPTPTPVPRFTAGESETAYILLVGRTDGARALSIWLRTEGRTAAAAFIPDELAEPMFTSAEAEDLTDEVPAATDETRRVRVAADDFLLESGLLADLLPRFEAATGYICEVYAGDLNVLKDEANAGDADILLMKRTDASALGSMTHYPTRYDFVSTVYSLTETDEVEEETP